MPDAANLDQRIQVFRNMVQADPDNELANFSLGKLLFEKGDLDAAETFLRRAVELHPRLSAAVVLLGELLIRAGRRDDAIAVLEPGVRMAHAKGEYQPRNRMQELLRGIGVEPPDPASEAAAASGPATAGPDGWACRRCGLDQARVERPPFKGALGEAIAAHVCAPCWDEWKKAMSIKVINEYRLNLATEQGSRLYDQHLREFLGLVDA